MSRRQGVIAPPTLPVYTVNVSLIPVRAMHGSNKNPFTDAEIAALDRAVRDALNMLAQSGGVVVSGSWGAV